MFYVFALSLLMWILMLLRVYGFESHLLTQVGFGAVMYHISELYLSVDMSFSIVTCSMILDLATRSRRVSVLSCISRFLMGQVTSYI
jgi:hypothetical protein